MAGGTSGVVVLVDNTRGPPLDLFVFPLLGLLSVFWIFSTWNFIKLEVLLRKKTDSF